MFLVDVEVTEKHRTDEAVLVSGEGGSDVWLPLSQVEIGPSDDGLSTIATMPEWLAAEKELI